jgi:hypothetical protein
MMKKAALVAAPTLLTIPKMNRIMTSKSRFFSNSRRLTAAVSGTNLLYFSDHQWNDSGIVRSEPSFPPTDTIRRPTYPPN